MISLWWFSVVVLLLSIIIYFLESKIKKVEEQRDNFYGSYGNARDSRDFYYTKYEELKEILLITEEEIKIHIDGSLERQANQKHILNDTLKRLEEFK